MRDFTGIWVIPGSPGQPRAEEIFGYRCGASAHSGFSTGPLFTAHFGGEFIWQTKLGAVGGKHIVRLGASAGSG